MGATGTGFSDEHKSVLLRMRGELKAYATALADSASHADDLVQEASLRALQYGPGLPPAERLQAWMFRVVRNLHVDGHRRPLLAALALTVIATAAALS